MSALMEEQVEAPEHAESHESDPLALVEQRVRELLEAGEPLSALSVERIFGTSREQLASCLSTAPTRPLASEADRAAFLRALRSRAARTERQLFVSADERGVFFPEPSHEVPEALGNELAEIAAAVADRHSLTLLVEERPVRGRMPEIETPAGCLRLVLGRPALYADRLVVDGRSWPFEREGRRAQVQPVRYEGQTIGAREGESSAAYLRLFVHPFLAAGELSLARRSDGAQLLDLLTGAASTDPARAGEQERLEAALAALELVRPIAQLIERTLPDRLAALDARQQTLESELHEAQARIVDLLAQRRTLQGERETAVAEQAALGRETVVRALRESTRIAQLQPVRSVGVVASASRPQLRVQLHPVVLSYRGENYLCRKLAFTLPLTDPSPSAIRWERSDEVASPHPHVAPGDHHTCWGEASAHLAASLGRGELAAAVVVIAGWARLYNPSSPYYEISNFPTTTLEPGFHPEVDA